MIGRHFGWRSVEQQNFGKAALLLWDRSKPLKFFRIHDGKIKAGLRAVVKENRIDDLASACRQTKRNVRNSEDGFDVRDFLFDQTNGFDRFDTAADIVFIACSTGEHERV